MLSKDTPWYPADLADEARWIHVLSDAEVGDIHAALNAAKDAECTFETLTKESFPLSVLPDTLALTRDRLENDLGLFVLRGFPVEKYSKADLRLIYWGIGLHMGTTVSQSSKGDVLGDVKNFGNTLASATGRGYMSREQLGFHTDTSDVVALFVLQTAKNGGQSLFCSSVAIRDKIATTWPQLHDLLTQPFYWSWKGQEAPGEAPYYQQPIFSYEGDRFSSRYIKTHILSAQEYPEVPRLTPLQQNAMAAIDLMANDPAFHFSMMFEPGDFQFLNNHFTYHARTEFDDYDEEERRRHLLRMWLAVPNSRQLSADMTAIYRDPTAGAVRGGFPSCVEHPVFETKVSEF